jgi:hypothetical protein
MLEQLDHCVALVQRGKVIAVDVCSRMRLLAPSLIVYRLFGLLFLLVCSLTSTFFIVWCLFSLLYLLVCILTSTFFIVWCLYSLLYLLVRSLTISLVHITSSISHQCWASLQLAAPRRRMAQATGVEQGHCRNLAVQ